MTSKIKTTEHQEEFGEDVRKWKDIPCSWVEE